MRTLTLTTKSAKAPKRSWRSFSNVSLKTISLLTAVALSGAYFATPVIALAPQPSTDRTCFIEDLGIQFTCDPEWLYRKDGSDILFVLKKEPLVTFTLTRITSQYRFLSELTRTDLEDMEIYQDGFAVETIFVNGISAIKVKAFSQKDPGKRITDYFFLSDGQLYGLLFSVDPKDQWGDYQFVIQELLQSVRFSKVPLSRHIKSAQMGK